MKRIELVEHPTKWGCSGCVYEDNEKGCWEAPDCGKHAVFEEVEYPDCYDIQELEVCDECNECSAFCEVCGHWYPIDNPCEFH